MSTPREKKRQEWPRVRQIENHGEKVWMCDGRINGRGKRHFFMTATEADAKADQLRIERRNEGTAGAAFPAKLRVEALDAQRRLAAVGATITDAVDYFLKHAKPPSGEKTAKELVSEFLRLKAQAGRRPTYLSVQKYVLENVFGEEFGDRLAHQIGHLELEEWMGKQTWALRTRKNYHRDLSNLFGFAIRRGYCALNPLDKIEEPNVTPKAPGILTPEQAGAMLTAAEAAGGEMVPVIAIGLFCGLRTAEIERLDWRHVRLDAKTIEVTAENAKMSERRVVDMPANLIEWLRPYVKHAGHVAPQKSFDWRLKQLWQAAKLKAWPKNAMRHSFASYHFAQHQNAALTTAQLGHFGSTRTFINSYRGVVQPAEAEKFWKLTPVKPGKVLRLTA